MGQRVPRPGDIVTVTADADVGPRADTEDRVFYWTADRPIGIPNPHQRSVTFCMPSRDITFTANFRTVEARTR
jgi:hypothetical protein